MTNRSFSVQRKSQDNRSAANGNAASNGIQLPAVNPLQEEAGNDGEVVQHMDLARGAKPKGDQSAKNKAVQFSKNGNIYSVAIAKQKQAAKGWCYAATTVIVRLCAGDAVTQRQIVTDYQVKNNNYSREVLDALDYGSFVEQFGDEYGVEQVSGTEKTITEADLTTLLEVDIPAIIGMGGHSRVAYRYDSGTRMVTMYDPLEGADETWLIDELPLLGTTIVNCL